MKLSILIAYYDTYDLTIKLLKELSIQKTSDVEIILVDDGCHEERFDTFKDFKIIHLEKNVGMSNALNKALEYANGKYIGFIDSDDMITMDYIDVLLDTLKTHDEDIIYFNWADFNINEIVRKPENYALWKAIYKKDIFPKFEKDRRKHNDIPVQKILRSQEHTEYYIDRVLYIYNSDRVGSITWKVKEDMIKLEVTYEFSLFNRFNEVYDIVRKNVNKNKKGWLYVGDTFKCEEELAKYLTGENSQNLVVAKVIEVEEPKEIKATIEYHNEPIELKSVVKKIRKTKKEKKNAK